MLHPPSASAPSTTATAPTPSDTVTALGDLPCTSCPGDPPLPRGRAPTDVIIGVRSRAIAGGLALLRVVPENET